MKVTVFVTPKKTVLDPHGAAVGHAMAHLDLKPVGDVRVGKVIEFELEGKAADAAKAQIERVCRDLLSNPVIEDFRYEIAD